MNGTIFIFSFAAKCGASAESVGGGKNALNVGIGGCSLGFIGRVFKPGSTESAGPAAVGAEALLGAIL